MYCIFENNRWLYKYICIYCMLGWPLFARRQRTRSHASFWDEPRETSNHNRLAHMPISDTHAHVRIARACHADKHSSNIDHAIKQLNNTSTSALQGKCVIFAMLRYVEPDWITPETTNNNKIRSVVMCFSNCRTGAYGPDRGSDSSRRPILTT